MTFDEFIAKWTGKTCDFDGEYGTQCYDLFHFYCFEVLGLTDKTLLSYPSAYQIFTDFNHPELFDKIANTPTGVPQKGDIVVWGTAIGQWGHVAIFVEGDTNSFKSFDANWPVGTFPHIQNHNYIGVLGWLHPKTQQDQQALIDQLRAERDTNWNLHLADQQTITQLNLVIESQKTQLGLLNQYKQALISIKQLVYGKFFFFYKGTFKAISDVIAKAGI